MSPEKAALILEDGTTFEGKPFGAVGKASGLTVFYTGVVGYQELLTNPSYRGMLAVLTYPIIGSYGVNAKDNESPAIHAAGLIIREYSRTYSNFRATGALEDLMKKEGLVGIREVDTRAVAVHLRERGEMRGTIASGKFDARKIAAALAKAPAEPPADLVREVTWAGRRTPAGKPHRRVAVLNLGVKESLLAQLAAMGCAVEILKGDAGPANVVAAKPKAVILAGGPGDPTAAGYAVETARALLDKVPMLGIGLGLQVLALALGCRTRRMKTGHRGVNYPVRDLAGGKAAITIQHHSYVVDGDGLPGDVEITHTNLNDGTVEGIRCREVAAAGVQFHPAPDDMGQPSHVLRGFLDRA